MARRSEPSQTRGKAGERAVIRAVATFGHVNAPLNVYRLHMPCGACEDVEIAGYMQGAATASREYGWIATM